MMKSDNDTIHRNFTTNHREETGIKECRVSHKSPLQGYYREICFNNIHILYENAMCPCNTLLYDEFDAGTVKMCFVLKGKCIVTPGNFKKKIPFGCHRHNIICSPCLKRKVQWDCEAFQWLEVSLTPGFFKKLLPEDLSLPGQFRHALDKRNPGVLYPDNNYISLQMYQIINEIIQCERKDVLKKMFMEVKVTELLLLQFDQLVNYQFPVTSLSKTDVEKIYAVREFILNNLTASCLLKDLAIKVGTNEFKLKKGFKELFGTTVFGFWNDAKMEQAKEMLTIQKMNVNEVSNSIGYKNARHFSAAFQRKFGILPSRLKK